MRIFYLIRLDEYGKKHADARKSLTTWKNVVLLASWKNKQDVLSDFPRAKMIKNNRARFEIVHNTYRLIAHIHYDEQFVEIRFIGTHNEYDRIDPETI
ncbi:MAG: type II toxin-antitoxin system HigB family toxin [Chitinophagales bacterium]|nr:type II toxin-antitoxin system HigB family toxin [Chitinophagales bacterium]